MFGWIIIDFFYRLLGHDANHAATRANTAVAHNLSLVDQYDARLAEIEIELARAARKDDLYLAYDLMAERDSLDRMRIAARIGAADAACDRIYAG